jgi:hypothetical protein
MTMGRSSRAVLTLKCLVAPVTGVQDEEDEGFILRCGVLEMALDHDELYLTLAGVEIFALHMMDYCCLLVIQEPGSKEYRRVGLGYVRHQGDKSFKQVKDGYLQLPWKEELIVLI